MPASEQTSKDPLADKLDELEHLLQQQVSSADAKQANNIPVLDEVVTKADYQQDEKTAVAEAATEDDAGGKLEKTHHKTSRT